MSDDFQEIEGVRAPGDFQQPAGDDPEAQVESLASEIDETRGDLTETVQAIGEKLDPANIAREASQSVQSAAMGKVDQMTYGAQETWRDVRTGNTGSIVDTITSNPVPAGMVALGLGMLFMSRGRQGGGDRGYRYADKYGARGFYRQGDTDYAGRGRSSWEASEWDRRTGGGSPVDRVGATVAGAGDRVSQAAGEAGQKAGQLLDDVGETAGQIPQQAGYVLEQGGSQVRRFLDENPLGAGVIALAAGAAVGMLLPSTPMEREAIGPVRDRVMDRVEDTAQQALDKVDQQVDQAQASPA
jgi:hypothetical protein